LRTRKLQPARRAADHADLDPRREHAAGVVVRVLECAGVVATVSPSGEGENSIRQRKSLAPAVLADLAFDHLAGVRPLEQRAQAASVDAVRRVLIFSLLPRFSDAPAGETRNSRAAGIPVAIAPMTFRRDHPIVMSSRQRVHDHRACDRSRRSDQQRRKVLLDPGEHATIGLLGACVIVEDADRGHGVVGRVDHVIGHEAFDIADDRNGAFLDPACQFLGRSGLCLALTDGGVHEILLRVRYTRGLVARFTGAILRLMQRLPDSILKEIGDVSCKLFNSLRTMEIQMGAGIVLLRYESPLLCWFVIAL
jgi:hypothetical protein